jgi:DNA-binding transcriptional ArsR family regulator
MDSVTLLCPSCKGSGYVSEKAIGNSSGKVSSKHPSTSKKAASSPTNILRNGTQRYKVIFNLANYGPQTAASIADRLGVSRNQIATRLQECREAGLVEYVIQDDKYVTDKTSSDSEGRVQQVTWAGLRALA